MSIPTGIRLLDHLFEGGLPERATALVFGPAFLGKEELAHQAFRHAVRSGIPGILVLTQACASEVREQVCADPAIAQAQDAGLLWFVDAYSRSVGAEEKLPQVVYTDGATDLNAIAVAVNRIQGELMQKSDRHLILVDSVSTLIVHANAGTVFRFLQVLTGTAKRAGATSLLLLDQGMHSEAEVQMFRHLSDGALSVRGDPGRHQILVEGLRVKVNPGWIDYRFDGNGIEMTGSLAGGRIR